MYRLTIDGALQRNYQTQRKRWQSREMGSTVRHRWVIHGPTVMSSRRLRGVPNAVAKNSFLGVAAVAAVMSSPQLTRPGRPAPEEKAPGSRLCPPGCRIWACGIWASAILLTAAYPLSLRTTLRRSRARFDMRRVGSRHPRASPARRTQSFEGRLGGLMNVGDFKVESVEVDAYEKTKRRRSHPTRLELRRPHRTLVSQRREFLEAGGAVDLGLK